MRAYDFLGATARGIEPPRGGAARSTTGTGKKGERRARLMIRFPTLLGPTMAKAARGQAPNSSHPQADPAEEVRQMQKRFADAIQRSDTAALAKIWRMITRSRTAPGSS